MSAFFSIYEAAGGMKVAVENGLDIRNRPEPGSQGSAGPGLPLAGGGPLFGRAGPGAISRGGTAPNAACADAERTPPAALRPLMPEALRGHRQADPIAARHRGAFRSRQARQLNLAFGIGHEPRPRRGVGVEPREETFERHELMPPPSIAAPPALPPAPLAQRPAAPAGAERREIPSRSGSRPVAAAWSWPQVSNT